MDRKRHEDSQKSEAWKSLPVHAAPVAAALAFFGFAGAGLLAPAGAKAERYFRTAPTLYAPYPWRRAYTGYYFAASNFCQPNLQNIDGDFAVPAYDSGRFVGYVCQ